jgi:putative endonuclease
MGIASAPGAQRCPAPRDDAAPVVVFTLPIEPMPKGYVYIVTNRHNTTLYVGVTSELQIRSEKHRCKFYAKSFSARYNVNKLVYYEVWPTMSEAIAREKQLKAGSRKKKIDLINKFNPQWRDLMVGKINPIRLNSSP